MVIELEIALPPIWQAVAGYYFIYRLWATLTLLRKAQVKSRNITTTKLCILESLKLVHTSSLLPATNLFNVATNNLQYHIVVLSTN
jgi:hypothetical protein